MLTLYRPGTLSRSSRSVNPRAIKRIMKMIGGRIDGIADNIMLKFWTVVGKAIQLMYKYNIKNRQGVG